jgi:hypothetical protein
MSQSDEWTPDQPQGTEAFEQSDEAFDEASRLDPNYTDEVEQDPSLEPARQLDDRELEEAGAEFDDPEALVTLQGGIDDPDGLGAPTRSEQAQREDEGGWDLDEPISPGVTLDEDS